MNLTKIIGTLKKYELYKNEQNLDAQTTFKNLETNSRLASENSVFVCIDGFETDGHLFAEKAVEKGVKLLIVTRFLQITCPQILVKNSRKSAAVLANLFFDNPTSKFTLIGVTGTNGKTTTTNIIAQILKKLGEKVGVIGTSGYNIENNFFPTERTTPDIIKLNQIFSKMVQKKIKFVVMEVSSHALALDRVFSLNFDGAIFTNLTQDHLDFHKNLDEYANEKFKLFRSNKKLISVINTDDKYGKILFHKSKNNKFNFGFEESDYSIKNLFTNTKQNEFQINYRLKTHSLKSNLIGKFNCYNLVAAIALINEIGKFSLTKIIDYVQHIEPISGRLEKVKNKKNLNIFIDYAHTPDALKNILSTLSKLKNNRLICVFGAGGNRDRNKRPKMLQCAIEFADLVILTNDNPRFENPANIIRDILKGAKNTDNLLIIRNRKIAIQTAINLAKKDDVVIIAGKGHESYQEIDGIKHYFSDKATIENATTTENNNLAVPIDPLFLEHIFNYNLKTDDEFLLNSISTDSRTSHPNSLFFALKGDNFDGHKFVENVIQNNCWAIVNADCKFEHNRLIKVENTLHAYGKLASKYKSFFDVFSIAITGIYGKTTTKEFLANILQQKTHTLKTFGNENNLIGLPKTIFKLQAKHNFGIFEIGTNQIGEIATLTKISQPDFGVITAIGPSHLELLKDETGVYKEKTALFRTNLKQRFFSGNYKKLQEFDGITFGEKLTDNYQITGMKSDNFTTNFMVNNEKYTINTPFSKYALNATIAVAICTELGFSKEEIRVGLQKNIQISMRMQIENRKDRVLIIDCYNANPNSMESAINFWNNFQPEKPHFAILGDMLELGELTKLYHQKISTQLESASFKKIISVGKFAKLYGANSHFDDVEKLLSSEELNKINKDAVLLIKASHGINLEKILGRL
ncbi:MAG: UDP-N-acetylmuramoyl-L-alanyl-D-glutamate--2,6-diaminopimelate ligase [Candidatus Cloacimonetes bacterium]|nr:UDP-N-acetylmuramoyl-L-alanyl-D-glutamate--2,6-diaminopimelate ligase [Candidatus Cloacimonadota bacterium]MBT6994191.1 UDP-N-acetylmuramoyl-L-alanyl-D-glutamate--2,6-diaminopimelate ligase [Candidatus Cloacimonadota bacterium]MBT7469484.1 UDP-N-acetylmuramoyl-L-alanyl-D-glutamate--2,6-diaminopimelate ligase [Candidatus Cloacimonadota bacterium]